MTHFLKCDRVSQYIKDLYKKQYPLIILCNVSFSFYYLYEIKTKLLPMETLGKRNRARGCHALRVLSRMSKQRHKNFVCLLRHVRQNLAFSVDCFCSKVSKKIT